MRCTFLEKANNDPFILILKSFLPTLTQLIQVD